MLSWLGLAGYPHSRELASSKARRSIPASNTALASLYCFSMPQTCNENVGQVVVAPMLPTACNALPSFTSPYASAEKFSKAGKVAATGPAEAGGNCHCGAKWLQRCALLLGDLWPLGPAGNEALAHASFVSGALRKGSVGLCKGHFLMHRACVGMLASISGQAWYGCSH
jgi:hypothetical protein